MFVASSTIANETHRGLLGEYLNWKVIVGYALMFAGMLLGVIGYGKGVQVKSGSVTETIGIVEVAVLSAIFFKEKLTRRKVLGIVLIIGGIVMFHFA